MNLTSIKLDDIVEVEIRGDRFYALVTGKDTPKGRPGKLSIEPINKNRGYYSCRASQVVNHFRRRSHSAKKATADG